MKQLLLCLFILTTLSACSTYEKTDLYGEWQNAKWNFVFNEDGSCKIGQSGKFLEGNWTYRAFGNTLEIMKDGTVFLSGLTVKGIENDQLTLEFRQTIGDNKGDMEKTQVLNRVK